MKLWFQFSSCATHGPHVREPPATRPQTRSKATKPGSTFEGLIVEKTFPQYQSVVERFVRVSVGFGDEDGESNTDWWRWDAEVLIRVLKRRMGCYSIYIVCITF